MQTENYDVIVVGDGIVACSLAYWLTHHELKVCMVSKVKDAAATGAAGGMLTPAGEAEGGESALLDFAVANCHYYPEFIERLERELGCSADYRRAGTLMVALNVDDRAQLMHLGTFQKRFGLETRWLNVAELRELEPCVSPRAVGALFAPDDHSVNPRKLHSVLMVAALQRGIATVECDSDLSLIVSGGVAKGIEWCEQGEQRRISATHTVVCSGVWANEILGDVAQLPLRPVRGQFVLLNESAPVRHVIRSPNVYLVPRGGGELFIGATSEERGFDCANTAGGLIDLLGHAHRILPGIDEAKVREISYGFRPALRDNLPAIGQMSMPGLYVATGHFRHGIMLAPLTGKLLAREIAGGGRDSLLSAFSPNRFS